MSTYLHIASGALGLLVGIDRVMEVGDIAAQDAGNSTGLRPWRNRNLPVVDLATRLGGSAGNAGTAARQQVILRHDNDEAFALDVDRVLELVEIDEHRLQPVSEISVALAQLVDAAWPMASGQCLLRLRTPFTWATNGPATLQGATSP